MSSMKSARHRPSTVKSAASLRPKTGFALWMDRVLEESERAENGFEADPVHDLRVALRRCRSLADGLKAIDPDPGWRDMKRAGRMLFQSLGELRDVQVMEEWVGKIGDAADPVCIALSAHLAARQPQLKQNAAVALSDFDRKQWKKWGAQLPRRAARLRPGNAVFKNLALERWMQARELHVRAMRNGSAGSLHSLRIGIKRFRYTVENFLPEQHASWKNDLKEMQDLLGEIHDLDVLWTTIAQVVSVMDTEARAQWRRRINEERSVRLAKYKSKMAGPSSLWHVWRAALPSGKQVEEGSLRRFRLWASYLDPDVRQSANVARLALQMFDQLPVKPTSLPQEGRGSREILGLAALLHQIGTNASGKKKAKSHLNRTLQKMDIPVGWALRDVEMARAAIDYHNGKLVRAKSPLTELSTSDRREAMRLGGILRLAKTLGRDGLVSHLKITAEKDLLVIAAQGYLPRIALVEELASARYLLETVYRKALLVKPLRGPRAAAVRPAA